MATDRYRPRRPAAQRLRRRDGENARARTDIEHALAPARLEQGVDRLETTSRRAVMTGPEGKGSLDLDAEIVRPQSGAVMRAMHQKTPGPDGLEPFEARGDPILRRERLEARAGARLPSAGDQADKIARRGADREGRRNRPRRASPSGLLEGGDGGILGIEDLAESLGEGARPCASVVERRRMVVILWGMRPSRIAGLSRYGPACEAGRLSSASVSGRKMGARVRSWWRRSR